MTSSTSDNRAIALCLPHPPGFIHKDAVAEMVEAVAIGLRRLGRSVALVERLPLPPDVLAIVMLPNLLDDRWMAALPNDAILFNFEQIGSENDRNSTFHAAARRHVLWDYNQQNLARLRTRVGHDRLVHVPAGHVSELARIEPLAREDIDVLFYGAPTPRRREALRQMAAAGLGVRGCFGVYGAPRDALIARAKLVVNIHHAPSSTLETLRLTYLMSNRKAVLTEMGPQTAVAGEEDLLPGLAKAPYDHLTEAAWALIADPVARATLAARGHDLVARRDMVAILRRALDQTATFHRETA